MPEPRVGRDPAPPGPTDHRPIRSQDHAHPGAGWCRARVAGQDQAEGGRFGDPPPHSPPPGSDPNTRVSASTSRVVWTASRARAWARRNARSGCVASEAPVVVNPIRAAVIARRRGPWVVHRHGHGSNICIGPGNPCGRTRPDRSSNPCWLSHASNSGAGRRPRSSRMASASWNEVL